MPGYDGTGPRGTGAMTGGGRGYCAVPIGSGGSRVFRGGSQGRGGGSGRRNRYYATGMTLWQRAATGEEKEMLKEEAEALKRELESVQNRIQALDAQGKEQSGE